MCRSARNSAAQRHDRGIGVRPTGHVAHDPHVVTLPGPRAVRPGRRRPRTVRARRRCRGPDSGRARTADRRLLDVRTRGRLPSRRRWALRSHLRPPLVRTRLNQSLSGRRLHRAGRGREHDAPLAARRHHRAPLTDGRPDRALGGHHSGASSTTQKGQDGQGHDGSAHPPTLAQHTRKRPAPRAPTTRASDQRGPADGPAFRARTFAPARGRPRSRDSGATPLLLMSANTLRAGHRDLTTAHDPPVRPFLTALAVRRAPTPPERAHAAAHTVPTVQIVVSRVVHLRRRVPPRRPPDRHLLPRDLIDPAPPRDRRQLCARRPHLRRNRGSG